MREHDIHLRSIAKSITWRILATITTILLVLIFTGEVVLALGVGIAELVIKFILYFIHERIWDRVAWGKMKVTEE